MDSPPGILFMILEENRAGPQPPLLVTGALTVIAGGAKEVARLV